MRLSAYSGSFLPSLVKILSVVLFRRYPLKQLLTTHDGYPKISNARNEHLPQVSSDKMVQVALYRSPECCLKRLTYMYKPVSIGDWPRAC